MARSDPRATLGHEARDRTVEDAMGASGMSKARVWVQTGRYCCNHPTLVTGCLEEKLKRRPLASCMDTKRCCSRHPGAWRKEKRSTVCDSTSAPDSPHSDLVIWSRIGTARTVCFAPVCVDSDHRCSLAFAALAASAQGKVPRTPAWPAQSYRSSGISTDTDLVVQVAPLPRASPSYMVQ